GYRLCLVVDLVAQAKEGQREVRVFGQSLLRKAIGAHEQLTAPGTDGSWDHRDTVEQGKSAPIEVLAGNVFERLPVGEQIEAVPNLGIAGHCSHSGVDKVTHQFAHRIATKDRVGIESHDDVGLGLGNAIVERLGLATIRLGEEMHTWVSAKILADALGGGIT